MEAGLFRTEESGGLRNALLRFMEEYVAAKRDNFANHPLGYFVRNTIPDIIYDTDIVDKDNYEIQGSIGEPFH